MQVVVQQFADDEAGGFVVSCAECHLRVDDDVIFSLRDIMMKCTVDDTTVANDDGLEEILFPFLVPVFVFGFLISIFHLRIRQGKIGEGFFERILIV